DALTYSWSAPSGGSFTGSGASVTYTAPAAPGIYAITCTVDDGKGATATGSTSVTVTAGGGGGTGTAQGNVSFGTVPSAAVKRVTVSPATVTINPGDPVTITATGLDNPGNAVASVWNWSQVGTTAISPWRGTFDQGTTGTVASWRTFDGRTDPGPVTITARSANNQTASMVVMVANKAPVISTITPAATCTVARNVPLNFHVVFHDANGDNNTVSPPTLTPNTNHGGYGQGWSGPDYNGDMTVDVNINSFTAAGTKTLSFSNSDGTNTTSVTWNITIL
ncbi:MAG: hypothetical protein H7338_20690, partial [Candidatus Sericytochromatia bacterium]|nr:hypothetical protein [Candidatus Sericytochromatia bacterium]